MRTLSIVVASLALLCAAGRGQARRIVRPGPAEDNQQRIAELTEQIRRAKLGQIALLIDRYSEGKSRLLIHLGARANPKVSISLSSPSTQTPFITVYPASSPVTAELDGVGECGLLGAAILRVDATAVAISGEGDERVDASKAAIESGVYLLAYMKAPEPGKVCLVAVTVDDEGRAGFREGGSTLGKRSKFTVEDIPTGLMPAAAVEFPNKDEIAKGAHPARARVRMVWPDFVYRFALYLPPLPAEADGEVEPGVEDEGHDP